MDGNMVFNMLLLGQKSDLKLMGRRAAEPWNDASGRPAGDVRRKTGDLLRFNPRYEPCVAPSACCGET